MARTMRMVQANNQTLGSPCNRINILARALKRFSSGAAIGRAHRLGCDRLQRLIGDD